MRERIQVGVTTSLSGILNNLCCKLRLGNYLRWYIQAFEMFLENLDMANEGRAARFSYS